jgi:hypothetical protein
VLASRRLRGAIVYFHLPMVAEIIVAAVVGELTIAYPGRPALGPDRAPLRPPQDQAICDCALGWV